MTDEFYMRPLVSVRDVPASVDYYCRALGFELNWQFGDQPTIIAQVGRNGLDIILDAGTSLPRAARPTVLSLSLHAPEQLGPLHEEFARGSAIGLTEPAQASWDPGVYEFRVEDPDGNVLVFWGDEPK